MSGIAGLLRLDGGNVDPDLLARMTAFQAFRGPHGHRTWTDGSAGLGHALFKLSDDDKPAPQPATLEGEVWITAHARIDAQAELIAELRGMGRDVSAGAADAELLLHAYHAWGEGCAGHILGDFTFAIWDARQRRMFCAVDHFGIRPFYYANVGGTFVFSNTLDCVRQHPAVSARLDDTAVGDFLLFGHYQDRDRTVYADVRRLAPAHCLVANADGLAIRRYWDFESEDELDPSRPSEIVERFRSILNGATRDRLRTRQVAVYMSGGLDSTLVAASAARILAAGPAGSRITAYTTVFGGLIPDDEENYAREAAASLGLGLRLQSKSGLAPFDWINRAAREAWLLPEPANDPGLSADLMAMKEVADDARLVLTGWEGDAPLQVSFPQHWARLLRGGAWRRLAADVYWYCLHTRSLPPAGVRTAIRRWRRKQPSMPGWLNPEFVRRADLVARWHHYAEADRDGPDMRLRHGKLRKVFWSWVFDPYDPGWTGYAHESAHPLMDLRMMRFFLRLPPIPWCVRKHVHREAARGMLPERLVMRPKTPLAADPVRAAIRRNGIPSDIVKNALRAASDYVGADRFPLTEGVDYPDSQWVDTRPVQLGGWLMTTHGKRSRS